MRTGLRAVTVVSSIALTVGGLLPGAVVQAEEVIDAPGQVDADTGPTDELAPFVEDEFDEPPAADFNYDVWNERWGQSLGDVPFGAPPDSTTELTGGFEAPANVGDQYAMRIRTLVTPTESGKYRFSVAGDDDVRLFLNPRGDDPRGARRVAYIAGWTTPHQFDRFASQTTAWFDLEKDVPYYVEVIGKEGSGDDHFEVAWELHKGFGRTIIPADVLEATRLGEGGWRVSTPIGLPDTPAPFEHPQFTTVKGVETLSISWAPADDADWYEVRLEGGGQARDVVVTDPFVAFDNLVPDSRYLLEVAPANAAARLSAVATVVVTAPGPYPTPVAPAAAQQRPGVTYDRWDTGWWTLTSVPAGQAPSETSTLPFGLETIPMQGENHAARIRAVLQPEASGEYTFFLSADDDARLLFNPDGANADGAEAVASVAGWTRQYQWNRYDSQASATYKLKKDRTYYIEAIAVHGLGLDHLEVGWSHDGGPIEVVPNAVLSPTMAGAGGWRQDSSSLPAVPGEPKDPKATATSSTVTLSWSAPKVSDDDGPVEFYEVVIASDGGTYSERVDGTTVTYDGLFADTEYEVDVVAWNASGGGKSESKKFKTRKSEVPDKVKHLKAAATSSSVTLSWETPKVTDEHHLVDHYEITVSRGEESHVEEVEGTATSATFEPLEADTEYEVTVTPWNELGAGKSESEKFKTRKPEVPKKVKHLKAAVTSSSVTLSWETPEVSDDHGPAFDYEVIITSDEDVHVVVVSETTVSFSELEPNASYEAEVVAWNDWGAGKGESEDFKTDKADKDDKADKSDETDEEPAAASADRSLSINTASVASTSARRSPSGATVDIDELVRRIESFRTRILALAESTTIGWI